MEKDFAIFDVSWMINTQLREEDKRNSIKVCYTLLKFCYAKKMILENPLDEKGNLKTDFAVKRSGLTDNTVDGESFFYNFSQKWFGYTDRTKKYDNVEILEKWYQKTLK